MLEYGSFKFFEASSQDLKNQIYRLRYEVYALEFGFENPFDFPDKLEIDEYDEHSIHFVAANEYDEVIGTVRMIMDSEKGFPIEHASEINNFPDKPENDKITEISRLAVSKALRRRPEDGMHGIESYIKKSQGGVLDEEETEEQKKRNRRKQPVIVLGLYRAVYQKCKELDVTHMYMITEEKLFHALYKFGFVFSQVGPSVEYHGKRTPYATSWDTIERHILENNPELMQFLTFGLDKELIPEVYQEYIRSL